MSETTRPYPPKAPDAAGGADSAGTVSEGISAAPNSSQETPMPISPCGSSIPRQDQNIPLFGAPLLLAVIIFASVFCGRILVLPLMKALGMGFGTLLGYALAFGVIPALLVGGKYFKSLFSLDIRHPQSSLKLIALGALAGALNYVPCLTAATASKMIFLSGEELQDSPGVFSACWGTPDAAALALALISAAPCLEEAVFRGMIQPLVALRFGKIIAVAAAAIGFAVMHLDGPHLLIPRIEMGVIFGILALASGSILPAAAAHAAHNALGILAECLISPKMLQNLGITLTEAAAASAVFAAILVWILLGMYRRREQPSPEKKSSSRAEI